MWFDSTRHLFDWQRIIFPFGNIYFSKIYLLIYFQKFINKTQSQGQYNL